MPALRKEKQKPLGYTTWRLVVYAYKATILKPRPLMIATIGERRKTKPMGFRKGEG
jgi:hypothetical protein